MGLFDWWIPKDAGENRQERSDKASAERKLSPAMPMAGAGAQLAGDEPDSETEEALKRAVDERKS